MDAITLATKKAGSQAALAAVLGVTRALIGHWTVGKQPIPPRRAVAIERATGVTVEELRPDLIWQRDRIGQVVGYVTPVQEQILD